jgi:hypothetical protein
MPATASRTSIAADCRSVAVENSTATRLEPYDELDEIDVTPCTRETALSMMAVICASMLSGVAPG